MCHKLQRMIIISEKIFFIFVEGIRDQLQLYRAAPRMFSGSVAVAVANAITSLPTQTQFNATNRNNILYRFMFE